MGLDMYLSRKFYIWSQDRDTLKIEHGNMRYQNVKEIVEEAGYWRKANAIHQWFVENVQDGNDDCGDYYVSEEQMKELLETVNKVLEASELVAGEVVESWTFEDGKKVPNKIEGKVIKDPTVAKELLPVQEGFFFGGTEYDEWYYQNLEETKKILETCLNDKRGGDYEYHSSW